MKTKKEIKTMRVYKTIETGSELIGTFTNTEYKMFMKNAEIFMLNVAETCPHLVFIRGAFSAQLWDEYKHKAVLTYNAEFISNDFLF